MEYHVVSLGQQSLFYLHKVQSYKESCRGRMSCEVCEQRGVSLRNLQEKYNPFKLGHCGWEKFWP